MIDQEKIRQFAEEREVCVLLHFTQLRNLGGIVKHGLLSRDKLAGPEYMAHAIDYHRLDERGDAISTSISQVNSPVFAKKRHKSGHTDWVTLVLPSHILWTHRCLFSWRNAATNEIKYHWRVRDRPWAFFKMFDGSEEERKNLERCMPTDIEAEVQVLEPIERDCILGVVVYRPELVEPVQRLLENLPGKQKFVVVDEF